MTSSRMLAAAVLAAPLLLSWVTDAHACSCVGPRVRYLTPDRLDDAPLNARVRLEVPLGRRAGAPASPRRVLRENGTGREIEVTERAFPERSPLRSPG